MDLKKNYEAVKKELEDAKKKPEILREKFESADRRLAELGDAINAANRRKEQALVAFASGDITEAELKTARVTLEKMLNERSEIEEFLSASEKASRQLQKTIADLSEKLNGCRHEFWGAIATELKSKITSDVIAKVHAVYAAASLAGGVGVYENFLRQLFPLPPLDEKQRVEKEMIEKYGLVE